MIRITIKIKNDHRSLSEDFECDSIQLSRNSEQLHEWIKKMEQEFNQEIDEVIVKAKLLM